MQKTTAILVPRNFKNQEDGIKSGRQNKAGINLKIQNPSLQAIFRTTPFTARPAGREIDQTVTTRR
jgi:hypothetical protein